MVLGGEGELLLGEKQTLNAKNASSSVINSKISPLLSSLLESVQYIYLRKKLNIITSIPNSRMHIKTFASILDFFSLC